MEGNKAEKVLNSTNYITLISKLGEQNLNVSDFNSSLWEYVEPLYKKDVEERYGKPMEVIGLYIALASMYCIVAMGFDLVDGWRSRKLWFPCRAFIINALSLTVMAVAMKLPVDLSGSMPGVVDQVAKLGSLAFMCTMMANLLPSIATMDKKTLLANVVALGVLVITIVVNICIQIVTGVVESEKEYQKKIDEMAGKGEYPKILRVLNTVTCSDLATVYVAMLLILLIIYVCSSLAILKSKQIIEHAHQKDAQQSKLTVEELQQEVSNYWIKEGISSPQFIIACYATTTVAGVICTLTFILHTLTMGWTIADIVKRDYDSDYKWSMLVILIVQFIGVLLGTVAPVSRCFASLSFKVTFDSVLNHIKVFTVEKYWTQKLLDWKSDSIRFRLRNRKRNVVLKNLKSLIFHPSIILQKLFVVVCKTIALIPFFGMIIVFACAWCLKWLSDAVFCSSRESTDQNSGQLKYVSPLENEMEVTPRILENLTKSLNGMIQRGEKKQPNNLINLIKEKSAIGFQGVKKLDNNDNQDSSLDVVNLTTIFITYRMMKKVEDDSLLKSVREGLEYVTFVEKILNTTDDYVSIRKAAETLWEKIDCDHKWLGIKLKDITCQVNDCQEDATVKIVKLFFEKAEEIKKEGVEITDGDSVFRSICANSMSSITKTIIDDQKESQKKSFDELISSRIAEIMVECLTNLPQVIIKKCHTDVIEKREKSVKEAARILGETKEIIKTLQDHSRHVPGTEDPDNVLL